MIEEKTTEVSPDESRLLPVCLIVRKRKLATNTCVFLIVGLEREVRARIRTKHTYAMLL